MKQADIIVIGAGAAGLMAAYGAAGKGADVAVLEKMPRPGRKIVITGKGRCNFTNVKDWNDFQEHIHPKAAFLRPSFQNLTPMKLIEFFEAQGMESVVERGDRAFPTSHKSMDVVDALVGAAQNAGARIYCNCTVTNIIPGNGDYNFIINCADGSSWRCRKLIITTGGLSYPRTGSTGDGYAWVESFGHKLTPRFPSLTAITPKDYRYSETISLKNVDLTIFIDGNEAQSEFGDLDFTDGGIEGPIGFKVSRKCVKALSNGSKVVAVIDLKPAVTVEDLDRRVQSLWNEISKDKRSEGKPYKAKFAVLLGKLLPMDIVTMFMASFPELDHKRLAKALKNWKMDIVSHVGYERCVITAGGVSLDDVNQKTLESKKTPGLYLAGEILDLDADTGGYNLHIAFSTGYLAGLSSVR